MPLRLLSIALLLLLLSAVLAEEVVGLHVEPVLIRSPRSCVEVIIKLIIISDVSLCVVSSVSVRIVSVLGFLPGLIIVGSTKINEVY